MNQTVLLAPSSSTATKPEQQVPDGERDACLDVLTRKSFSMGHDSATTIRRCNSISASMFSTPFPPHDVKRKVLAVLASAKLAAERAETDPVKVVSALNKRYAWLSKPMAIYDLENRCVIKKDALKAHYANTEVILTVGDKEKRITHFDAWMQSKDRREHTDVTFAPGSAQIVDNHVNVWIRWAVTPVAGDVSPWKNLMDLLFGSGTPERTWSEQWFAYPIQHPGKKLHSAMVIWGGQGVGKTLVAESVGKLYARHFKTITSKILRSKYNGWAHDALLVFGEEKDNDQRAEANQLKHFVTGPTITIEEKYRNAFECRNRMNFIFTSNHPDAFLLDRDDRRYFVWNVVVAPRESAFYDAYGAWIGSSNGMAALMDHLLKVDLSGFDPHGHAPMTKAKQAMIQLSKSDLELWVIDALTDGYIDSHIRREIATLAELVRLYQQDTGSTRTTPKAMSMALRKQADYAQDRISVHGKRVQAVTLRNHAKWDARDRAEWSIEFQKASPVLL